MKIYTLDDYNHILFDGCSYNLPENTMKNISGLIKEVEAFAPAVAANTTSEDKQKRNGSRDGNFNKKPRIRKNDSFEDWGASRSFKTTVIEKKEGTDKIITEIRACLNKISAKNYENQKNQIVNFIHVLAEDNDEHLAKIGISVFEVASNNKFNSLIYADLYKDVLLLFPQLKNTFDDFLNTYIDNIKQIHYVDSNVDYDKYCDYNKQNDKRKAISTFLSNLVNVDVLTKERAFEIIIYLQTTIREYMDTDNKTNEIEEITENLYLFVTILNTIFKEDSEWTVIIENVREFSRLKAKDKKSLSSRAVFKYMDILEAIEKQ
jgi:negative regulator of replication initiation